MEETLTPRRRVVGGLSTITFDGPAAAPIVVLLHGYGADAADLAPLAFELDLPKPARWAFPDAPLDLPFGGKMWFEIDAAAIQRAQATGVAVDLSTRTPEGLEQARLDVEAFLKDLGASWKDVILGGFSQGAMLAAELAFRAPENPRGLALLSGNLLCAEAWTKAAAARKGTPFFMSHGSVDPILGFKGALALEKLLREAGLEGELLRFEGGHSIPPEVMAGLRSFLTRLL